MKGKQVKKQEIIFFFLKVKGLKVVGKKDLTEKTESFGCEEKQKPIERENDSTEADTRRNTQKRFKRSKLLDFVAN